TPRKGTPGDKAQWPRRTATNPLAQPRPQPRGQPFSVREHPRDALQRVRSVHPVLDRVLGAERDPLALEQGRSRVILRESLRRALQSLADELVTACQHLLDDLLELAAKTVVCHGAAIELEVLGVEVVAADADEKALRSDLQVLAAHRSGAPPAELDGGALLVRPLVLREAQVPVR